MTRNIVIVGVGGQGTLLASKVLGRLAMAQDLAVKVSEVHGMAQRGGGVITHVRFGETVHAPLVAEGEADVVVAFEPLEALRSLPYLKPEGVVITSTRPILPMPVITGAAVYPQDALETLAASAKLIALDAQALAEGANAPRAVNIVLLGVLAAHWPIPKEDWLKAIAGSVPAHTFAGNQAAFEVGYEEGTKA